MSWRFGFGFCMIFVALRGWSKWPGSIAVDFLALIRWPGFQSKDADKQVGTGLFY